MDTCPAAHVTSEQTGKLQGHAGEDAISAEIEGAARQFGISSRSEERVRTTGEGVFLRIKECF